MKAVISTENNGKPIVLSFAEKHGHIKYLGYSDGWLHKENGCNGTLAHNGQPGHFDCRACGASFKKQSMLATQVDTRDDRAKDLISTVRLELRNEKIGLIRFVVRSQSRPKAYLVYRDNHGNWTCPCEDFQKHKQYDAWHCKHVLACEYWLENEQKERALPQRPSLICTGTQDEFELANKLDEKQIVQGNDGVLAYLINGKVTISFCGMMELATRHGIRITDIETTEASDKIVAVIKAHNPATGNTQAGAHSQAKLLSGRPDNAAEAKAIGKAKRNACLKILNEVDVYTFANKHAQNPPFDYLEAFYACQKVYIDKGLGDFHVSSVVKELYPDKPPADIDRDGWIAIYQECQKQANELANLPDVEKSKSYWAKTESGDVVLVTENGEKSPSPSRQGKPFLLCEYYFKGYCERCIGIDHKQYELGLCNLPRLRKYKVACMGDDTSGACRQMSERYPRSFGIIPPEDAKYYDEYGNFNPNWWKEEADYTMAVLKNMTVFEYRAMKYVSDGVNGDAVRYYDNAGNICKDKFSEMGRA